MLRKDKFENGVRPIKEKIFSIDITILLLVIQNVF